MFIAEEALQEGLWRADLGCSYMDYDFWTQRYLDELLDKYNLRLEFFFDGRKNKLKDNTLADRKKGKDSGICDIFRAAQTGQNMTKFVCPPLLLSQFMSTLQENLHKGTVAIHECEYEADQNIAIAVQQHNRGCRLGFETAFVLGEDSDFIAMKAAPYITFGALNISPLSGLSQGVEPDISSFDGKLRTKKVWRRSEVAEALAMTEDGFLELCIMFGNDYTKGFKRTLYEPLFKPVKNKGMSPSNTSGENGDNDNNDDMETGGNFKKKISRDEMIDLVKRAFDPLINPLALNQGTGTCSPVFLTSKNVDLDLAIRYSRSLYNLEDISSYPDSHDNGHDSANNGNGNANGVKGQIEQLLKEDHKTEKNSTSSDGGDSDSSDNDSDSEGVGVDNESLSVSVSAVSATNDNNVKLLRLSAEEKKHFEAWMLNNDQKQGRNLVGGDVYAYLLDAVKRHKLYTGTGSNVSIVLKNKHLEAFRLLRELYTEQRDENGNTLYDDYGEPIYIENGYGNYDIGTSTGDLDWENLYAGMWIEMLFKVFMKNESKVPNMLRNEFRTYEYASGYLNSPAYYYDPNLYQAILKQLEAEIAESSNTGTKGITGITTDRNKSKSERDLPEKFDDEFGMCIILNCLDD